MSQPDKGAALPTAQDLLQPDAKPHPPPKPTLYSIAVSLSGPPPPPPPVAPAATAAAVAGPPAARPAASILNPQHFPSLSNSVGSSSTAPSLGAWAGKQGEGRLGPQGAGVQQADTLGAPESEAVLQGPISVEWLDLPPQAGPEGASLSPAIPASSPQHSAPSAASTSAASSGLLNLPVGSVHLYRHAPASEPQNAPVRSSSSVAPPSSSSIFTTAEVKMDATCASGVASTLLAVLAVPSYLSPSDFLRYVQIFEGDIECLRLIRDVSPSRSIVLVQLRSTRAAEDFMREFNGKPFSAFEPERCHVVPILHVLTHFTEPVDPFATKKPLPDGPSEPVPSRPFPVVLESERASLALTDPALEGAFELPSCAVCLERLDSAVTGLVTVPCLHTYHCACLRKWGDSDSRCPVCRYSSKPLHLPPATGSSHPPVSSAHAAAPSSCASCSTTEALWICLICGNVGCGRYSEGKHAERHYQTTGHMFALELDTQRCWNYAADEYVHRIVMDKSSGSLVELPSSSSSTKPSTPTALASDLPLDKLEALSLEYSHLLSGQLHEQRQYFLAHQASLEDRIEQLEQLVAQGEREKDRARIARLEKELRGEREMNRGLVVNLEVVRRRAEQEKDKLRAQLVEKDEELRDVMFFLEARDKIAAAEAAPAAPAQNGAAQRDGEGAAAAARSTSVLGELQGGTVVLPPSGAAKRRKKAKKKALANEAPTPALE